MRNTPAGQQLAGFMRQDGGALEGVHSTTASGSAYTIDARLGNVHDITLTANCTFTINAVAKGFASSLTLIIRQDATGSRTVTWPGSVTWLAGSPALHTAAASIDVFQLMTVDGGTTWLGSQVNPSSGASSGCVLLFDSTLGANAVSIDTGAGGIASGYKALLVEFLGQTTDAAANGTVNVTVNNDTGANYDFENMFGNNTTASVQSNVAQTSWAFGIHGASGTAAYPSALRMDFPNYTTTTFNKSGLLLVNKPDGSGANAVILTGSLGYRSTAAISQLKIASATANLAAGSRLSIWGLQ